LNEKTRGRKSTNGTEPTSQRVPLDVDAYIDAAPRAAQPLLRQLRSTIRTAAPQAQERISYGMPTYEHHGRLVYFAGYKGHVGVYGIAHVDEDVASGVKPYLDSRSTLRFPVDRPLPLPMIRRLVRARVKANEANERTYNARVAATKDRKGDS
jgi:uncharacterized protein YdhG (YjbR/CyaY superfamily)